MQDRKGTYQSPYTLLQILTYNSASPGLPLIKGTGHFAFSFIILMPSIVSAAAAKSLQSCPTLSDPMDCILPGSSGPWGFPGKITGLGYHRLLHPEPLRGEKPSTKQRLPKSKI